MGKGVALAFKRRFPTIMAAYGDACRSKLLVPGGCLLLSLPDGRKWAALATKNHWRDASQLRWVQSGLFELAQQARRSEEHTSELQSLMRISYAVFCLKKKKNQKQQQLENSSKTKQAITPYTILRHTT